MKDKRFYVTSLHIQNFRLYSELDVDFHPFLTVLVARNGGGKTTILQALASALSTFVFATEQYEDQRPISPEDVRVTLSADRSGMEEVVPTTIQLGLWNRGSKLESLRTRLSAKSRKKQVQPEDPLAVLGHTLHKQVIDFTDGNLSTPPTLPLIAYYGTQRLWGDGNARSHKAAKIDSSSRFQGYRDCLDPSSSYRFFELWLKNTSFSAWQAKTGKSPAYKPREKLAAVQKAVALVLADVGWGSIQWNTDSNCVEVEHPGQGWFRLASTSDGITNIVGLVADIAHRCVRLNPQFGDKAATKTPGVVLIDEVDMHLHPEWQQCIIGSLQRAFPLIQFIVTTHSPQVLSTVKSESIRVLSVSGEGDVRVTTPTFQTQGVESASVLAQIMGVDPIPPVGPARWVADYQALIEDGKTTSEAGQKLWTQLVAHFGEKHPIILECERLLRWQSFKLRRSAGA